MSTVEPFPIGLSDGLVEAIADEIEAAGTGSHAPVLKQHLTPYAARWLTAGVPQARVEAEMARISEALAVTIVARKAKRVIEENTRNGGPPQ